MRFKKTNHLLTQAYLQHERPFRRHRLLTRRLSLPHKNSSLTYRMSSLPCKLPSPLCEASSPRPHLLSPPATHTGRQIPAVIKTSLLFTLCLLLNFLPAYGQRTASATAPKTKAQGERKSLLSKTLTVAQDGSGDYKTVQAAFDAIPHNNKQPVTIFVKRGTYKEKILLDSAKKFVTLRGEDKFNTVLTYDDHTGKVSPTGETINTRTSWSFKILADDFSTTDITFQNDAGFNAGQAVAVEADGDRSIFKNCRFIGYQDVLFTNSDKSRQYYENCYIEGTTDFIFGSATVWFQQCHIHSKKNSHVTAASTPKEKPFGYVFNECVLTADSSLHSVSLGRPWQKYAAVIYLHCYICQHIRPEGWSTWNNNDNHLTARYAEYKNYGPSADAASRVSWARQLSDEEAKSLTVKNVLGGWEPLKK